MPVVEENVNTPPTLATSREPKLAVSKDGNSLGEAALRDALIVIGACWVGLFLLVLSLRSHNI